jgi:hypothetical protein
MEFYWHHGLFMGPRMLADAAPAWSLLAGLAMFGLVERLPSSVRGSSLSPRGVLATTFTFALLAGLVWFTPARLAGYAMPPSAALADASAAETPALVFVHGGRTSRIAMRLAAAGTTLDSVETAIRQNPTCHVQEFLDGSRIRADLDFTPRATNLPPVAEISPGRRIRVVPGAVLPPSCQREIASDARGTVEVATLYWKSDLPGVDGDGVMFVRDLGPAENTTFMARYPDRRAYVILTCSPGAMPELVEYGEGIEMLWGPPVANRTEMKH